jgi:hypothetical protein
MTERFRRGVSRKKSKAFRVGQRVTDTWFGDYGIGVVTKVMQTRIRVDFPLYPTLSYDRSHWQFLQLVNQEH